MSLTSMKSFASNLSMQSNQSYQSFSDFSEYNNDFELGNDWGFYEDIEIAPSENNYNSTKVTPKYLCKKYGDLSIPPFNNNKHHETKMQKIAKILETRIPLLENRALLEEQEKENEKELCIKNCYSQYFTNRVLFTTFVIIMMILK